MKKLIALSFLSLGIVFLAGCGQQQNSQTAVNQNQNTNQAAAQNQDIVYTNTEYGFTLIFPETWKDYTVKNETFDGMILGSVYTVGFGFTAQDALFYVEMYSESQWAKMLQSEEGPVPTYLGENTQYVFAYMTAQDAANETMVARMSEVKEIVKTFTIPTIETEKTFEGNGFSFTYPVKYTADSKGLWTEEGYKSHINPPAACDICQIPEVEVKATTSNNTMDQQIIADYDLPGTTLADMSKQTGIKYEEMKIGDNDFIKITVGDNFDVTGYYTKYNSQIVAFRVYWTEKDNEALKEIISTLKFQ